MLVLLALGLGSCGDAPTAPNPAETADASEALARSEADAIVRDCNAKEFASLEVRSSKRIAVEEVNPAAPDTEESERAAGCMLDKLRALPSGIEFGVFGDEPAKVSEEQ